ncbi:putative phage tail assembly chaperone [Grimontia marina]|uniref:Phage tail assembly chaperone n=1 Tax=Grimontia marina TaxID=646534 RepID=A0A128FA98_9GAMM|nr:putative phage tail assembly chaperone [Grimontia marina]CZF83211.1 hypothetical protein GMA8713_02527 [Grimontia marina]
MNEKGIELTVEGKDITFSPSPEIYGQYIGAVAQGDIADASHNFVMQSVNSEDSKGALRQLAADNPGAMMQLASVVMAQYAPKVSITIKK